MRALRLALALVLTAAFALAVIPCSSEAQEAPSVTVGSKKFTENVILGEMLKHLALDEGLEATHLRELGGTRILWNALLAGEIDLSLRPGARCSAHRGW